MKRLLKYSLRTSLVVVTLLCCLLAYISNSRRHYRSQHEKTLLAMEEFERDGGVFFYSRLLRDLDSSMSWTERLYGERHLDQIRGIYIGPQYRGSTLSSLRCLGTLEIRLALVDRTEISSDVLCRGLLHLPELNRLHIRGSTVTGRGWWEPETTPDLRVVSVQDSVVDDSAIPAIAAIPTLEALNLDGMRVDCIACTCIARNAAIVGLSLSRSTVTDECLRPIASMDNLRLLHLRHTACTDAMIDWLAGMPQLEWVDVTGSSITAQGITRLKEAGIAVE